MRTSWLEERKRGLGGSDAATLLGLSNVTIERDGREFRPFSKVKTRFQLWLEKTGQVELDESESLYTLKGHAMEPLILKLYEERTGAKLLPKPEIWWSKDYEWAFASLDGLTEESVVDAKTSVKLEQWGDDGSDIVPMPIYAQMQWYMLVTGWQRADVMAWLECGKFMDVRLYHIYPDEKIRKLLIRSGYDFWRCVKTMTPPEPMDLQDVVKLFPTTTPKTKITATPAIFSAVEEFREIRNRRLASVKEWEDREDRLKFEILRYAEDNEQILFNDRLIARISTSKNGRKTLTPIMEEV